MTLGGVVFAGALLITPAFPGSAPKAYADAKSYGPLPAALASRRIRVQPPTPVPIDSGALEQEVVEHYAHAPLARVLQGRTREPATANRIARAIVKEANRLRVAPSLLAGVLLTENPGLRTAEVSSQGAIGLMQVMHFHAGTFDCGSDDLLHIESNICHGARVFGSYLRRTRDLHRALLRYNGCVASTNTPNCHRYPFKVMRQARLVRRQLLTYPPARAFIADTAEVYRTASWFRTAR